MLGIVDLLVFFNNAHEYALAYWEYAKEAARQWLGPSPNTTYLIFDNEEVIPAGKEHCKYAHTAHYTSQENRITAKDSTSPYKRLPWISIQYCIGDHIIDISDWLSETRANTEVSLIAMLRLASWVLNIHLPEAEHAKITVITRDGEEEEYKFVGRAKLLRRITPEQTCELRNTSEHPVRQGESSHLAQPNGSLTPRLLRSQGERDTVNVKQSQGCLSPQTMLSGDSVRSNQQSWLESQALPYGESVATRMSAPEPIIQHRPTMPFDGLDGGGLFF